MIDLSKFVDKQVRVTFRNGGEKVEGEITFIPISSAVYPYILSFVSTTNKRIEWSYTKNGRHDLCTTSAPFDITHIEEIKPMNKYEELEKQVAEMQKEIDRLKAQEEKKQTFEGDIRSILLTDTQHHRHRIDYLTQKICETVENYIPKIIKEPEDNYDGAYNNAIYKMKQNLGLK